MYPYYHPWYGWIQNETVHPYYRNYYQPHPYVNASGTSPYGFDQGMYAYQNPYPYSYGYQGYTENSANTANPAFTASSVPQGVMSYFQDENGQIDFDKMMSTTGQVIKTVQQVSPVVKGIGSFVKGMK